MQHAIHIGRTRRNARPKNAEIDFALNLILIPSHQSAPRYPASVRSDTLALSLPGRALPLSRRPASGASVPAAPAAPLLSPPVRFARRPRSAPPAALPGRRPPQRASRNRKQPGDSGGSSSSGYSDVRDGAAGDTLDAPRRPAAAEWALEPSGGSGAAGPLQQQQEEEAYADLLPEQQGNEQQASLDQLQQQEEEGGYLEAGVNDGWTWDDDYNPRVLVRSLPSGLCLIAAELNGDYISSIAGGCSWICLSEPSPHPSKTPPQKAAATSAARQPAPSPRAALQQQRAALAAAAAPPTVITRLPEHLSRDVITNGVLLVDKPDDWSVADTVGAVKRALKAGRVTYAGSLDEAASGLVILCLGGWGGRGWGGGG
jgi:hypothetical protein